MATAVARRLHTNRFIFVETLKINCNSNTINPEMNRPAIKEAENGPSVKEFTLFLICILISFRLNVFLFPKSYLVKLLSVFFVSPNLCSTHFKFVDAIKLSYSS